MKIIVAEDAPATRTLLERTLELSGHEVVAVENGAEALAALEQGDVRIVITDWMMPVMDGPELCRQIRARAWDRYVYVIMLTVRDDSSDIARGLGAGADDYITKPVNQDELSARLQAGQRILDLEGQLAERVAELEESLRTIQKLRELIPLCMYCKRVRDDDAYWKQIDEYLKETTGARVSHGICPDCYEKIVRPQLEKFRQSEG